MRSFYQEFVVLCGLLSLASGCGQAGSRPQSTSAAGSAPSELVAYNRIVAKRDALPDARPAELAGDFHTEAYAPLVENAFLTAADNPLSTFSIDVDTASYANVRRFLTDGQLPPPGAVRIEELVNYFRYDYAGPEGDAPFAVHTDVAACPWAPGHRLVRFGLKGREIEKTSRPPSNLVFLVDVSGSMDDPNKLPLVKRSLRLLVQELGENDRIALVVYAGTSGLVLPSTSALRSDVILAALDHLEAGGSTNGAGGIQQAYEVATQNFLQDGVNRVILCTDGDFNVGITDQSRLSTLIREQAAKKVFLSVLGFGMGNYKDSTMELLADQGNGNAAYIDTISEARKVLVEQMTGTLITIAKDVKIQVEFNPRVVAAYRLIGYENRMLKTEDFRDDTKDAGEIGAGHTVTALYEIIPVGSEVPESSRNVRALKYQLSKPLTETGMSDELLTLLLRSKTPGSDSSEGSETAFPVRDDGAAFEEASRDFQFAAAVAAFGMLLRDSQHKGHSTYAAVAELARPVIGDDPQGYRREFLTLVDQARELTKQGERSLSENHRRP